MVVIFGAPLGLTKELDNVCSQLFICTIVQQMHTRQKPRSRVGHTVRVELPEMRRSVLQVELVIITHFTLVITISETFGKEQLASLLIGLFPVA